MERNNLKFLHYFNKQIVIKHLVEEARMNSLRAFQDANSLGGFEISRVSNLGTSNSVWLCSYRKQLKLVLKYFPKDNHGNLHFKSEKNAILKNQELSFFPKMIAFDDKEK